MKAEGKKKFHYAWAICFACMLIVFQSLGVISNGFSMYLPFLIKEFSLTNAQNSFLMTARWVTTVLSMLFVNKYYEKLSYRTGMAIATLLSAVAHLMYSYAGSYTFCIISSLVMGLGYGLGSMIPVTILISRWFQKSRQLAMGITLMGSSFAVIVMPRLFTKYIEATSIQQAFRTEAIGLAVIAVIVFFIVRDNPSQMGLEKYGYDITSPESIETKKEEESRKDFSVGIWIMIIILGALVGSAANPIYSHYTINYTAQGYSKILAATYFSISGFVLAVAKVFCGRVGDKLGGLRTSIIFGLTEVVGYLLVSLAPLHSNLINYGGILFVGIGTAFPTMVISLWSSQLASPKEYPKMVSRMQVTYSLGSLIYSSVPGIIADQFNGSYSVAFIVSSATILFTLILVSLVYVRLGVFKKAMGKEKGEV